MDRTQITCSSYRYVNLQSIIKILVNTDISVIEFYGNIGNIGNIGGYFYKNIGY